MNLHWLSLSKSSIKWLSLWCLLIHKITLWLQQRASQFRAMEVLIILSTLLTMILIAVKGSWLINSSRTLIRVLYLHLIREVSIRTLILALEFSVVGIATLALLPFPRLQIIVMWLWTICRLHRQDSEWKIYQSLGVSVIHKLIINSHLNNNNQLLLSRTYWD